MLPAVNLELPAVSLELPAVSLVRPAVSLVRPAVSLELPAVSLEHLERLGRREPQIKALAKMLQGLAKKIEGKEKEGGMSGPAAHMVDALVRSVRIMGRRHAAKLTMKEMIEALQKEGI